MVTRSKRLGDLLLLANGLLLAIVLNQLAGLFFFRLDLTEERRYSIKQPTIDMLRRLDDDVFVEVYLEGDLNAGFRRLRKSIRETLEEFRVYSGNRLHYRFSDPAVARGARAQNEFMSSLVAKGIQPMNIIETREGKRTEKLVFPGAVLSYGGKETGVMLLRDQLGQGSSEDLNRAIEGVEFELASAIFSLTNADRKKIGFIQGHGEADSIRLASLIDQLLDAYDVSFRQRLSSPLTLKGIDVLVLVKPTSTFSKQEKYVLDQHVMRGGRLLILADALRASMDSASQKGYLAFPFQTDLDDVLFQYGVRINQDLVQDIVSARYPVVTSTDGRQPTITPLEWPFYPLVNHYADHPVTRKLDATLLRFASSMDTVKAVGIKKTPLLFTSDYSRRIGAPVPIQVNDLRKEMQQENFNAGKLAVGYLLEGKFTSVFKNRFAPEGVDATGFLSDGQPTKIIVVADGDLALNEVNQRTGAPQELGFDNITGHTYANKELIMNMISFLADEGGLITTRNKDFIIRPLDQEKVRTSRSQWQFINLGVPLVVLVLVGVIRRYLRKRKYGAHEVQSNLAA